MRRRVKVRRLAARRQLVRVLQRVWDPDEFLSEAGLRSLFAYLWYVPGYAWIADRQYKVIAGGRKRDAGAPVATASARQP